MECSKTSVVNIVRNYLCVPKQLHSLNPRILTGLLCCERGEDERGWGGGQGMECSKTSAVIVRNYMCVPKQLHSLNPRILTGLLCCERGDDERGWGGGQGMECSKTSAVIVRNYLCVPKQLHSLNPGSDFSASTPVLTKGLLVCYERIGDGGFSQCMNAVIIFVINRNSICLFQNDCSVLHALFGMACQYTSVCEQG